MSQLQKFCKNNPKNVCILCPVSLSLLHPLIPFSLSPSPLAPPNTHTHFFLNHFKFSHMMPSLPKKSRVYLLRLRMFSYISIGWSKSGNESEVIHRPSLNFVHFPSPVFIASLSITKLKVTRCISFSYPLCSCSKPSSVCLCLSRSWYFWKV